MLKINSVCIALRHHLCPACLATAPACIGFFFVSFFLTFFWKIMSQKKMDIHSDCNEHCKHSENITPHTQTPPPAHSPPRQWWILRHYWAPQNQWRSSPFSWWSQSLVPQIGDCICSIGVIWLCDATCTLIFLHHRSIRRKTKEIIWEALIHVAVDLELVSHV